MKNLSVFLLSLLLLIWILLALFFCRDCLNGLAFAGAGSNADKLVAPIEEENIKPTIEPGTWNIRDGSAFAFQSAGQFRFLRPGFNLLEPDAEGNKMVIAKVAEYLKGKNDRMLNIVGYYGEEEANGSVFPNLGLARANDIKKLLMSAGVNSGQLGTEGQLLVSNWVRADTLLKGIDFNFATLEKADDRLAAIRSRLVGKPLILYFDTNQDTPNLSTQQRQDFADIIYYLDNIAEAKIKIEGHTDNVGERAYNLGLSRDRAKFVLDYLSRNGGITKDRMQSRGFGPDQPITKNDSEENRSRNRRVEVILN